MPANEIRPIEVDGAFWVKVIMDGRALKRRGPFADAGAAEAMVERLAARVTLCVALLRHSENGRHRHQELFDR